MPFEASPTDAREYVSAEGTCLLRATGASLHRECDDGVIASTLVAARPDVAPQGAGRAVPIRRYVGADRPDPAADGWQTLEWPDAWPGIDVALQLRPSGYERIVHVGVGANPERIAFHYAGADSVRIDDDGALVVRGGAVAWRESAPFAWQDGPTGRASVSVAWRVLDAQTVGLELGAWDASRPLHIDPEIPAGGLFGPSGLEDTAYAVTTGPTGITYVGGGAHQRPDVLGFVTEDAFVLAIDPWGQMYWLTWIGGTRDFLLDPTCTEYAEDGLTCLDWQAHPRGLGGDDAALVVDTHSDRVAIAGTTWASDFPSVGGRSTPGLNHTPTQRSRRDAFLTVLDAHDGEIVHAGYIGGNDDDRVNGLSFVSRNRIDVFGTTTSQLQWFDDTMVQPNGIAAGWWQTFDSVPAHPDQYLGNPPFGFQASSPTQLVGSIEGAEGTMIIGHDGRPRRWIFPREGPMRAQAAAVGGSASVVRAFQLPGIVRGETRMVLAGVTNGVVGGFDGTACHQARGSACGGGPCPGSTDVWVAEFLGDQCVDVMYIGGGSHDVLFDAALFTKAPNRVWVVLVGRTASPNFPVRAAMQPTFTGPVGLGVEGFVTVVEIDPGRIGLSTFLGLRPPNLDESFTSDDVATGVAIAPDRSATVVGFTRTGLGEFLRPFGFATDFVPGDNGQAFVAQVPIEVTDLEVALRIDPEVVETAGNAVATVTVRNIGTIDATGVRVVLSSNDLALDPTGTTCTGTAALLTCNLPVAQLADGAEYEFPITVFAPIVEGDTELRATVSGNEYDPFSANNTAAVDLIVGGVDLAVTVTPAGTAQAPHVVPMSEPVRLTVDVRNLGPDAAEAAVTIAATEQSRYSLRFSGLPPECVEDAGLGLPVMCSFPGLQRGTPRTFTVDVMPPAGEGFEPDEEAEVRDAITVSVEPADPTVQDANPRNNKSTTALAFRHPDLVAVAEGSTPRAVGWGQPFTLQLAGRNDGPGAARGAYLLLANTWRVGTLPTGCSSTAGILVRCEVADGATIAAGGVLRWSIPLVAPARSGDEPSRVERLRFQVAHFATELNTDNNEGFAEVQLGAVDVGLFEPDPAPNYRVNIVEPIQWRVTNASSEPATGVSLEMRMDHAVGVELPIARVRGVNCTVRGGPTSVIASCEVGTIAAGESVNAIFDVRSLGRGDLTQSAVVATAQTNISDRVLRTVKVPVLGPDLRATLTRGAADPVRGQAWEAQLTLQNTGSGGTTERADQPNLTIQSDGTNTLETVPANPSCIASGSPLMARLACALSVEPGATVGPTPLRITPERSGPVRISATANDAQDEEATNGNASLQVNVRGAEIVAGVTLSEPITRNVPFVVQVEAMNRGPADAARPSLEFRWADANLEVAGPLPDGCTAAGRTVTCAMTLPNGESRNIDFPMRSCCYGDSQIQVTLRELGDPGAAVLSQSVPVRVRPPDVSVTMGPFTPQSPVGAGEYFESTVTVANPLVDTETETMALTVRPERISGSESCTAPVRIERLDITGGPGSCADAANGAVRCTITGLRGGEATTLAITARAICAGRARVHAELTYVEGSTPDPNPGNDRQQQTMEVTEPEIAVRFDPVAPEGPYTEPLLVTARVGGVGSSALPSGTVVEFADSRGVELQAVSTLSGSCGAGGTGFRCTLSSVTSGATADIVMTLRARSGPASGRIVLGATNAGATTGVVEGVTVRLRGPDLALAALSSPGTAEVGEQMLWTFTLSNGGGAPAESGAVTLTLPLDRLSIDYVDGLGSCRTTLTGRVCELPAGVRDVGSSATVTIAARATRPGEVAITAQVAGRYVPDENAANDSLRLGATVQGPDLSTAIALSPDTAAPGELVEATVTLSNSGSIASSATSLAFALGSRLTVRSPAAGCSVAQGVARCAVAPLAPATSTTFVFGVAPAPGGDIVVEASVSAENDEDPSNNRTTATLFVRSTDSDGDGISDVDEDAGPGAGDANGDSVPDRTQPHVGALNVPQFGAVVLEAPAGSTVRSFGLATVPAPPPSGVAFPMGALTFEIAGVTPGSLVPLRLTFPAGVPAWAWYKYDGAWTRLDWDGTTGGRAITQRTLELVLRDGGRGDDDGAANGVVRDPGAAGLAVLTVNRSDDAPDLAAGDGLCLVAGGGCTLRAALQEANAGEQPFAVYFDFAGHTEIAPSAPLPSILTPVVLDATDVPGSAIGERGVVISGRLLASGPLLLVEADGAGMAGIGIRTTAGDGIVVRGTGFRFAEGSLGDAQGIFATLQPWAALRADDPAAPGDQLVVVDSWLGSISRDATVGIAISAKDVLIEDVIVNLNVLDGRRPQASVHTGIHIRDAARVTVRRIAVNGAQTGVLIEGDCPRTRIVGSYFGLGADGFCHAFTRDDPGPAETGAGPCLDRNLDSLVLRNASNVTVGGQDPADRNVFGDQGVAIRLDEGSTANQLVNNWVGLAADGTCQPFNADSLCRLHTISGILLDDAPYNAVGRSGGGNVIGSATLEIIGAGSVSNLVEGNWIGMGGDLTTPLRPGFTASAAATLHIDRGAEATEVRDNTVGHVQIGGSAPDTRFTTLTSNRIGAGPDGASLLSSTTHRLYNNAWAYGLVLQTGAHQTVVTGNTFASQTGSCIETRAPIEGVEIRNNHVCLSSDGLAPLPCSMAGVRLDGQPTDTRIEDNAFGACATAASPTFNAACVLVGQDASNTTIARNTFGVARLGADGPEGEAIASPAPAMVVGRAPLTRVEDNAIFATSPYGIYDRAAFEGDYAVASAAPRYVGNRVGVDELGVTRDGVAGVGMLIVGSHAVVGGAAASDANLVRGSSEAGIRVGNVTGVDLQRNLLADNGGLGIALSANAFPVNNDPLDGDGGPNGSQNHPIPGVYTHGASASVAMSLASAASTTYRIDVYAVASVDPSGHGEADEWLGSADLSTDSSGNGTVEVPLSRPLASGERVTGTATGPTGTSEFGPAARVTSPGIADLALYLSYTDELLPSAPSELQFTIENTGPNTATDVVLEVSVDEGWALTAPTGVSGGSCTVEPGRVRCDVASITSGNVWEVYVPVTTPTAGRFAATGSVGSALVDPVLTNNNVSRDYLVGAVRYLMTARPQGYISNRVVGDVVPFEVEYFRMGARRDLADMIITVTPPADARVVGGDVACSGPGPVWTCHTGPVPGTTASQVWRVDLVFASPGSGVPVGFALDAQNPNADGPAQATAYVNLTGGGSGGGELTLAVEAAPADSAAGMPVQVVATFGNTTSSAADGVALHFDLPDGGSFRGSDAACVGAGSAVSCALPSIGASASAAVTLDLLTPADPGQVVVCATAEDESLELPDCATVAIGGGGYDASLSVAPAGIAALAGEPMTLRATITAPTGAPPTSVRWASSGPASARGTDCVEDGGGWRCAIPSLDVGGSTVVELELDPATTGVQRWTATLDAFGDTNTANNTASALVNASAAADCGGLDATVLHAPDHALSAAGFATLPGGVAGDPAWRLTSTAGSLTTSELAGGAERTELRVAWTESGTRTPTTALTLEVSLDGGETYAPVETSVGPRAEAAAGSPAEYVVSLLAPGEAGPRVRWRVEDGGADALIVGGVRVVACSGGANARADIAASDAFVAAEAPGTTELAFDIEHAGGGAIADATVHFAADGGVELHDARIDGGWCATRDDGTVVCTVPSLAPATVATAHLRASSSVAVRATVSAQLSARAVLAADSIRSAATIVRFGEAPLGSRATLAWDPAGLTVAAGEAAAVALELTRTGAWGLDGGTLRIDAAGDVWIASSDPRCTPTPNGLLCDVAGDTELDWTDVFDVEIDPGVRLGDRTVTAEWLGDGEPEDVASATLPLLVTSDAVVSVAFDAPASDPPAVDVTTVTLHVSTTGASAPSVVAVDASAGLVVRTATGAGAACAIRGAAVRCSVDALPAAGQVLIELAVAPEDAGVHWLRASVDSTIDEPGAPDELIWRALRDCDEHPCGETSCAPATCEAIAGCRADDVSGEACEGAVACGLAAVCVSGTCYRVGVDTCDDGNICTVDRCNDAGTCGAAARGGACEGACTVAAWCDDGACSGGAPRDCDDGDPCTAEACAEPDGCEYVLLDTPECICREGEPTAACEDDAWVTRDGCGELVSTASCDDGDACTLDACDDATGCAHTPLDTPECTPCVPDCSDRECGADPVCGAPCGACDDGAVCAFGLCIDDPCDELGTTGCCEESVLSRCGDDGFEQIDCGGQGCGWSDADEAFACGATAATPDTIDPICPWLPACESDADCDDADECTTDRCSDGACTSDPIAGCGEDAGPVDAGDDTGDDTGGDDAATDAEGPPDVSGDGEWVDAEPDAAVAEPNGAQDDSGCGCRAGGSGALSMLPWFGLLALRRRRRAAACPPP